MNVLITGATGGLGRAFAVCCAQRGYNLLLTDLCEETLCTLQQGIQRQYDITVLTRPCDITSDAEVAALMEYAKDNDMSFDMLLNVAGIDHEGGFYDKTFREISSILRVNIEATLRVTHNVLTVRRPKFFIVNVSSLASHYPIPLKATYSASKRFLLDFSIALSHELRDENVSVLVLCPGGLVTTDEIMLRIAAQGFWGNATTNKLERVVNNTLDLALRGKHKYIPGFVNRIFSGVGKLIPATIVAKLLHGRFDKAQKQVDAAMLNKTSSLT